MKSFLSLLLSLSILVYASPAHGKAWSQFSLGVGPSSSTCGIETEDAGKYCLAGGRFHLGVDFGVDGKVAPTEKSSGSGGRFGHSSLGNISSSNPGATLALIAVILICWGIWVLLTTFIAQDFKLGLFYAQDQQSTGLLNKNGEATNFKIGRVGMRFTNYFFASSNFQFHAQVARTQARFAFAEDIESESFMGLSSAVGLGFSPRAAESGLFAYLEISRLFVKEGNYKAYSETQNSLPKVDDINTAAFIFGYAY